MLVLIKVLLQFLQRSDRFFVKLGHFIGVNLIKFRLSPVVFLCHDIVDAGPHFVVRVKEADNDLQSAKVRLEPMKKVLFRRNLLL